MTSIVPALAACGTPRLVSSSRRPPPSPPRPKKKKNPPPGDAYIPIRTVEEEEDVESRMVVPLLAPRKPGHLSDEADQQADEWDPVVCCLRGVIIAGVCIIILIFLYGSTAFLCYPDLC
ncbi:hypothetical protein ACP70R_015403 [Stipagrostis hirtigluma subsp. patula]